MKQNSVYVTPEIKVIDIQSESMLCASNVEMSFQSYGLEDDWDE